MIQALAPLDSPLFVLGKSLGTRIMCHFERIYLANSRLEKTSITSAPKFAWLTPGWNENKYLKQMSDTSFQSLFIIGDKDPYFNQGAIDMVSANPKAKIKIFPEGDHSLDVDSSLVKTIENHQNSHDSIVQFFEEPW